MSDLSTISRIIRFFIHEQMRYKARFFGMLISHPFAILFLRFLPSLIVANILHRLTVHDFTRGNLWGSFGWPILTAVILEFLGGVVFWRVVIYFNWSLEARVIRDIYKRVFDHMISMSSNFHANHFGGSLVSQTSKLSSAYIGFTDTTVFQALGLFWGVVFASVLLVGKAPLYVAMLLGFVLLYVIAAVAVTASIRKLAAKEAAASNKQTGALADAITNVMAIKGFAARKAENQRFHTVATEEMNANMQVMRATLARDAGFGAIGTSINAVAVTLACASVVLWNADVATVYLILTYTGDILQRLWEFSTQAMRNYNRSFGDAESMVEILDITPEVSDPAQPVPARITKGAIAFENVTFAHDGDDDALFQELQLHIKAGEKIGLVGHSGSGKTTLTRLLLRFSDIDGGHITIDGQDIATITQDELREHIAYVPQEPLLFHRSIRENIAYGKPSATDAEIEAAAVKANAHEFIKDLKNGYDTLVGERGVKLSGGQRQRIAIARAILKDAPILVLDEATSALDSESEVLIQSALWELMKNRTAIVIAHRLSTVQKMDRIIVLDHGSIAEQGTHAELSAVKGIYAGLWAHQSGGFLED